MMYDLKKAWEYRRELWSMAEMTWLERQENGTERGKNNMEGSHSERG